MLDKLTNQKRSTALYQAANLVLSVDLHSTPPEALLGQVLGGAYRIESQLDEGGMGMVYRAQHVRLKRPVAVKVMAAHLADQPSALERFTREAEIISQLSHPHIVQVLDFNTTETGKPYLVMELLKGRSLDQVLERHPSLELGAALRIAIQAASALSAAHNAGIVHRDLKPANIFLVDTGDQLFVKLLDFGISKRTGEDSRDGRKLTGEFDILGTPDYMPPEQAIGKTAGVDHRGDQYALAVILYEMLAGHVPFVAKDVMELLQRVIRDLPVAPSEHRSGIPPMVDSAILRALSKNPADRFASIMDFAEVLEIAAAEARVGSSPNLGRVSAPSRSISPSGDRQSDYGLNSGRPGAYGRSNGYGDTSRLTPGSLERQKDSEKRRTSWHSKDPVKACQELIDRARQELGLDNLDLAVSCAESALEIAHQSSKTEVRALITKNAPLLERIFTRRLGRFDSMIVVSTDTTAPGESLTPEQAFLLSRIDGGLSIEEAIDLSPLSRELTLGYLVTLMRAGHIRLGA